MYLDLIGFRRLIKAIDREVITPSSKKGAEQVDIPKREIYSSAEVGFLRLVGLIKKLLPLIGITFLLAFIWSQWTTNLGFCS